MRVCVAQRCFFREHEPKVAQVNLTNVRRGRVFFREHEPKVAQVNFTNFTNQRSR